MKTKLTELTGNEILPQHIYPFDPRLCLSPDDRKHNKAVDALSTVCVEMDREELAGHVYIALAGTMLADLRKTVSFAIADDIIKHQGTIVRLVK